MGRTRLHTLIRRRRAGHLNACRYVRLCVPNRYCLYSPCVTLLCLRGRVRSRIWYRGRGVRKTRNRSRVLGFERSQVPYGLWATRTISEEKRHPFSDLVRPTVVELNCDSVRTM